MTFPFYKASAVMPETDVDLPIPWKDRVGDVPGYLPDDGLVDAVNVALALGEPLLLTGEPGTGKTQLAWHLSLQVLKPGRDGKPREPLVFEAKSTSNARELFYSYDTLGRFHKSNEGSVRNIDYISYNAFGTAILQANEKSRVERWLPPKFDHDGPRRSVVLIDEVDKAPRDFPNDILNELENAYFRIPELDNEKVSAPKSMKPILVITSNSEKSLPEAFLRRCVYYNIPFPNRKKLSEILQKRVLGAPGSYLEEAVDLFVLLRESDSGLRKKPATAELLRWLVYLGDRIKDKQIGLRAHAAVLQASLGSLIENAEDQDAAKTVLTSWLNGKR